MSQRIACAMALIAFAVCMLVGGLQARNSFGTTVTRALLAMVVTLVIGLLLGAMAQRMLLDNLKMASEKQGKNSEDKSEGTDR